jgi:hypothetical protein
MDLTVGTSGAECNLSTLDFVAGGTAQITSLVIGMTNTGS